MNEEIFEVFDNFSQHFKVASHFELMNDFPSLTDWIEFRNSYNYYSSYLTSSGFLRYKDFVNDVAIFFPPHKHEQIEDYIRRMSTTSPYNVYKHSINALLGIIGRKDATITNSEEARTDFLHKLDSSSRDWQNFIRTEVFPAAMTGLGGIFVDNVNGRPVWSCYDARHISRKHLCSEYIAGEDYLKRVVLVTASQTERKDKEYEYEECKKALCLKLIERSELAEFESGEYVSFSREKDPDNFVAVFQIYEKRESEEMELTSQGVFRNVSGETLNRLPFFLFKGADSMEVPFFSAAKKALKLADQESVFENGLAVANYPMLVHKSDRSSLPIDSEVTENNQNLRPGLIISPRSVFELPQDDSLDFLEYEGKPFKLTFEYLKHLAYQVSSMIANKLADQNTMKTKAEYEGQQMTNTSVVLRIVDSCENAVQSACVASIFYLGGQEQEIPKIDLNRDFVREQVPSGFVDSIVKTWASGLISGDLAINILRDKEIIETDTTYQEQLEKIEQEQIFSGTEPSPEIDE